MTNLIMQDVAYKDCRSVAAQLRGYGDGREYRQNQIAWDDLSILERSYCHAAHIARSTSLLGKLAVITVYFF